MKPELFDYEGRLFAIFEGSRGYVWQSGEWREISEEFAGRVWASGADATGKARRYGADMAKLPADKARADN